MHRGIPGYREFRSPKTKWWLLSLVLGALIASAGTVAGRQLSGGNALSGQSFSTSGKSTATGSNNNSNSQTNTNPGQSVSASVEPGPLNSTSVQINGQNVPLPANGTIHKTYVSGNGRDVVDIHINNSGGSSGYNSSSVNIDVNSSVQSSD